MKNIIIDLSFASELLHAIEGNPLANRLNVLIENATNPMLSLQELCAKLNRPLAIFDAETTGTNVSTDRVVSLYITWLHPDGGVDSVKWLLNPTIPIPAGASAIHKIFDEDVAMRSTFCEVSQYLHNLLSECDLVTFNGNKFDIPLLMEEFNRCGMVWPDPDQQLIDVSQLYREKNKRSLQDAHIQYLGSEFEGAHNSGADVEATFHLLLAMLKDHPDLLEMNLEELHNACKIDPNQVDIAGKITLNESGEYVYNFGKNKGKRVVDDKGYAAWMLDADFPAETKRWLNRILEKTQSYS
jgi:DNA polymerase-3 subunit epsilon